MNEALRPLAAAIREDADRIAEVHDVHFEDAKSAELLRCCARLIERGDLSIDLIHSCFGAPGDFGYSHPIGKALRTAYGC